MCLNFSQVVFITTIIYLFSAINDGYAGRSSKADWIAAHVLNGVHRDGLSVALYLLYFQTFDAYYPYTKIFKYFFLLLVYHFVIFKIGYSFGGWLRSLIRPIDYPDFSALVFIYGVKFATGVILFILLWSKIW